MNEHMCPPLEKAMEGAHHCTPRIAADGIHGCDDSLIAPVKFCPFCGAPWPQEGGE